MILTQSTPFTPEQIHQLKEQFEVYIKVAIDVEGKVCSAGMDLHREGEQILLSLGSQQSHIWGGGIDLATKAVDDISFINIRPNDNNPKNDIQNPKTKTKYQKLIRYFFPTIV